MDCTARAHPFRGPESVSSFYWNLNPSVVWMHVTKGTGAATGTQWQMGFPVHPWLCCTLYLFLEKINEGSRALLRGMVSPNPAVSHVVALACFCSPSSTGWVSCWGFVKWSPWKDCEKYCLSTFLILIALLTYLVKGHFSSRCPQLYCGTSGGPWGHPFQCEMHFS